jgi:hypothetical protein
MNVGRMLLFVVGCLGTRFGLAYMAKTVSLEHLRYMGYVALLPTIGFFLIYWKGWRKTGAEVFGEQIWWNSLRPVHGVLWLLFGIAAIQGWPHAWYILLADVMLGAGAYVGHSIVGKN